MPSDVIVALSTSPQKSGIGVVKMSGKGCLEIAKKMFKAYKNEGFMPNFMVLGNILLDGVKDRGFLVYFKEPHSYTGEDVVEFQCHGGVIVTQKIIEKALSLGARLADPGEFSKRAFLNGKMSLDEAEGVVDTINAESESELKCSNKLVRGKLFSEVKDIQEKIVDSISEIEVNLDYPDEDIEYKTKNDLLITLKEVQKRVEKLLNQSASGKMIKNGVNVLILGKTNVGKSSLLNALTDEENAIVTDIAGTTRDIVTGRIEYKGVKFNFFDTAGLRQTSNKIENIGIEKAKKMIDECDIILYVIDAQNEEEETENLQLLKDKKVIKIANKIDKNKNFNKENYLLVSAKNKQNIEEIKEKIYENLIGNCNFSNDLVLTNLRHIDCLNDLKLLIENAIKNVLTNPLELTAFDFRGIYEKLGEITGETANEKIIDRIFSKFCLGK